MVEDEKGRIPKHSRIKKIGINTLLSLVLAATLPTSSLKKPTDGHTPTSALINNGRLLVEGVPFYIKGVGYNPIGMGTDQLDTQDSQIDVPKIAALGANTISTYNTGDSEWDQYAGISTGSKFYDNLYPVAEKNNLKLIVGYFSNSHIDWTDFQRVAVVTSEYKALVDKAKDRPSTLIYLLGNEVFENMDNDSQKAAYAEWLGQMIDWTHKVDPNHPTLYADGRDFTGASWLRQYAANLDIYGVNDYRFNSATTLQNSINAYSQALPGKAYLLHEWGSDSFDSAKQKVDWSAQAEKIVTLAKSIDQAAISNKNRFIGSSFFEYSDDWSKEGSNNIQNTGTEWSCISCFDGEADEEYWGIATSVQGGSATDRQLKPSYLALQSVWE